MPLETLDVNLWKTCAVSYLQLDSFSTGLGSKCCDNSSDRASNCAVANMVVQLLNQSL